MLLTKVQLQNESLLKALGRQPPPRPKDMLNSTQKTSARYYESSYKHNGGSYLMNTEMDMNQQTIQSKDYNDRVRYSQKVAKMSKSKEKEIPTDSNFTKSKQSEWSASRKASNEVLSNLCDKIQSVSGLMNGHVRRIFSLQDFVVPVDPTESGVIDDIE